GGTAGAPAAAASVGAHGAIARGLALAVLALAGVFVLLTFDQHGISNDEEVQHVYGRLLLDFYASGFADRQAFEYKNLYLYGGFFDLLAAAFDRAGVAEGPALWDLRHLISAIFGLLGLAGTWLLARRLAGEWAGLAALVLLSITGSWSGAMFTHTKDIPFATTMLWALYFSVRVLDTLPAPPWRVLAGLGVALGCAFGLRIGAVFAVFYLGVGVLAATALQPGGRVRFLLRGVLALLPAAAIALALGALFWPWAAMEPGNVLTAMRAFSHFSFELDTVLAGRVMNVGEVPGHYLAAYLLVRLPELFLAGLALALLLGVRAVPALAGEQALRAALPWLPVVLAALFPLVYTLLAAPPLYNGLRHFSFVLPPLAVLAGMGLVRAWHGLSVRPPLLRRAVLGACALAVLGQLGQLARLHPYEYLAYNRLAGGVQGAVGRWEQDYWASSLREAVHALNALVAREGGAGRHYSVAVCAEPLQAQVWLAPGLRATRDWWGADFYLSPTHMGCDEAMRGRVVAQVERAGLVLAVVKDRRALVGEERRPR
ncbi:glycosyltransferase family 39 protein, partial [Thauera aminoaromatica]|uniref:glycosyltransferase family 39 protein n=1 Tax=Thauera aminoaromatica TaxID=164330 RepID=UPI003211D8E1